MMKVEEAVDVIYTELTDALVDVPSVDVNRKRATNKSRVVNGSAAIPVALTFYVGFNCGFFDTLIVALLSVLYLLAVATYNRVKK
jgi:hypothetical protein